MLLPDVLPPEDVLLRERSPRIMTSGWITVFPPSVMFWVPTKMALRATLLPVSWRGMNGQSNGRTMKLKGARRRIDMPRTVSIYSPFGALRDILSIRRCFGQQWQFG